LIENEGRAKVTSYPALLFAVPVDQPSRHKKANSESVRLDFLEVRPIHGARRRHGHAAKNAFIVKTWKMLEPEVAKLASDEDLSIQGALNRLTDRMKNTIPRDYDA
jgi:hypothetical protein